MNDIDSNLRRIAFALEKRRLIAPSAPVLPSQMRSAARNTGSAEREHVDIGHGDEQERYSLWRHISRLLGRI
jgi:hypothetical protein